MGDLAITLKKIGFKNKRLIIYIVLAIGVIFIMLSSCESNVDEKDEQPGIAVTDDEYCAALEEKVKSIVTAITGDNSCLVAITLENGTEYVYADQNKTDTDTAGEDGVVTKESIKNEQEYIIVKSKDGSQTALMITEKKPAVRGVAIVAKGINSAKEEEILKSVSAILGITSRRVSISSAT